MTRKAITLLRAAFCIVLAASFAAACGGGQSSSGSSAIEGDSRSDRRGGRGGGDDGPELTPEQIEEQRQAALEEEIQRALEIYASDDPDYDEVEDILEEVLEEEPERADVWFNIGMARYQSDNLGGAIEAWEQATAVDESYARGLANIGYLQLEDGDVDAARATFERCVERVQTEPGCNINLALLEMMEAEADGTLSQEEVQDAVDYLRFALGGDGRSDAAYDQLARIYFELGQTSLARLVCENAILLGIQAPNLHNRLGLIALAEDDVITAYAEFQRAVALDDSYLDAWMNIGAMALSFRDYEAGRQAFARVLESADQLAPQTLIDAKLSYGVALRGSGRLDEAQAMYEEVLEADPDDIRALYNLGVLAQEARQDYGQALEYYEQFAARNPEPGSALAEDVSNRITTLTELIEILGDSGSM